MSTDNGIGAVLIIRFAHDWTSAQLAGSAHGFARELCPQIDGLRRKIFLSQPGGSGGVYLFADRARAQAYLDGPIVAALRSKPGVSDLRSELFDPLHDWTSPADAGPCIV